MQTYEIRNNWNKNQGGISDSECCKQTLPLKEHRESERKRSTLILECKELLLKHYGEWCIICGPHDTVKGGFVDFELSKLPGPNPGIWY